MLAARLATDVEWRNSRNPPKASAARIISGGSDNPASAAASLLTECRHRCFLTRLPKLLRHFGIAEFLGVKIDH